MVCDTCEIKRAGACTAHGGTGWDPRAGPHPCPNAPVIARVIDAEEMQRRALLREPCAAVLGKKKPSLIDSDMEQAAMGIRGAAAAIQGTIFADSEPFDPRKAVTDLVGS